MENNRLSALFFKKPAPSGFFAEDQRVPVFGHFCAFSSSAEGITPQKTLHRKVWHGPATGGQTFRAT